MHISDSSPSFIPFPPAGPPNFNILTHSNQNSNLARFQNFEGALLNPSSDSSPSFIPFPPAGPKLRVQLTIKESKAEQLSGER